MAQRRFSIAGKRSESGAALVAALLLLLLMSALSVALIYKVNYEGHLQRTDAGNNIAFYGAEAGMEKMVSGLESLYNLQAAPTCAEVAALSANQPPLSDVGVTYPTYSISQANGASLAACAFPTSRPQTISHGPNAGLQAQIVPLMMSVSALRPSGESVSMVRQVEVARIPIFQFGVFSESDLSFFPGPTFDFSGRVHTNGNLFLAEGSGQSLIFHSAVRAAKDVVRDQLANGMDTKAQGRTGKVLISNTSSDGCAAKVANSTCLDLTYGEGSSIGGPTPTYGGTGAENPTWPTTSLGPTPNYYNSNILSGKTGAKALTMAFVKGTTTPIEIIRRPLTGEDPASSLGESRLYNQAQIRVLLSDDPAELPGGAGDAQNIRLANFKPAGGTPDYSTGVSVGGSANHTYFAEGTTGVIIHDPVADADLQDFNWITPINRATAANTLATPAPDTNAPIIGTSNSWNLLDGYLRVEYVDVNGAVTAVTKEWLELGFARGLLPPTAAAPNAVNPNAILILQQLADRNGNGASDAGTAATYTTNTTTTTNPAPPITHTSATCKGSDPSGNPSAGNMSCTLTSSVKGSCTGSNRVSWTYTCTTTTTTTTTTETPGIPAELAKDTTTNSTLTGAATRNNWYPINMYDTREGEFRDTVNASCKLNGALNLVEIDIGNLRKWLKGTIGTTGKNVDYASQNGYILYFSDRRGMEPNDNLVPKVKNGEYGYEDVINPSNLNTGAPNGALDAGEDADGNAFLDTWGAKNLGLGFNLVNQPPQTVVNCMQTARTNWVSGARHGVRLVDASQSKVPTRYDNDLGGFTLASENPAYLLGSYNADPSGNPDPTVCFKDPHAESAVIADTVTLLSNGFSDLNMWTNPADRSKRNATDTCYRVAIASGKNINFPHFGSTANGVPDDYGTDGGVHNFLRFLEDWGGNNITYRGSMASMYYSQYATGVFKCCNTVYGAPTRNYAFDLDFLDLSKMPPGTPTVTDVENLGFQQVF